MSRFIEERIKREKEQEKEKKKKKTWRQTYRVNENNRLVQFIFIIRRITEWRLRVPWVEDCCSNALSISKTNGGPE